MNWNLIYKLYKEGYRIPGIDLQFLDSYETVSQPCYKVLEVTQTSTDKSFRFEMLRLLFNKRKISYFDDLGLVGLNSLNVKQNCCFLTEGVSDFMSLKLMISSSSYQSLHPDFYTTFNHEAVTNVLGVTRLSGNQVAKKIILSLFDNYIIMTDNDTTGISNAANFRKFLVSHGKKVMIKRPRPEFKDISDEFVKDRKCYYNID